MEDRFKATTILPARDRPTNSYSRTMRREKDTMRKARGTIRFHTLIKLATKYLPPFEDVAVSSLRAVRLVRTYSDGVRPHEQRTWVIAYTGHPEYGAEEVLAYLTLSRGKMRATWGFAYHEVNGVAYKSRTEANRVRRALQAANIPHVAVMHPDAQRVLRQAGV